MDILDLSKFATALLAISMATERLVTIVKTMFPSWFADEAKTDAKEVDLSADKWRRLRVQAIAFGAAWITTALIASGGHSKPEWFGTLTITTAHPDAATPAEVAMTLQVWFVALLATGGSAFWAQVVGYTSAVKDIANTTKAQRALEFTDTAQQLGRAPIDSGQVVRTSSSSRRDTRRTLAERLDGSVPSLS